MTREGSLTLLQEEFKKLEKEEEDEVNNMEQFVIIPERAERQVLQINLLPAGIAYFRGEKIYSNTAQLKVTNSNQGANFWKRVLKRDISLSMLINDTPAIQILGIKHPVYSGQILVLDLSVYKQSFYYSSQHLIASRKAFLKQQARHQILPELRLIEQIKKLQNIFDALDVNQQTIVLQAESAIMEKYLAEDEQFYICHRNSLLAVSQDVKLQLVRQGRGWGIKAKGKGWLFYQTNKSQVKPHNRWNNILVYILVLSFITPILELMLVGMI